MSAKADRAVEHILSRILMDPRLAYYFDPVTQSARLLIEARAEAEGVSADDYRAQFTKAFCSEPPACTECPLAGGDEQC